MLQMYLKNIVKTWVTIMKMVEKCIRGGMCQATYRYAKANNKYIKNYDINQEVSYLEYLDANNLYGWSISKKLPVNGFEWIGNLSNFNEDFIKIMMMKIVIKDTSLKQI